MSGALIGTMAAVEPVSFNGTFSTTGSPTTITSSSRTARVPIGNGGALRCDNFAMIGTVSPEYQVNGGSWTGFVETAGPTVTHGQTLAFRITGAASGESLTFDLVDAKTNRRIEIVELVSS